jgi:hypothetical protein
MPMAANKSKQSQKVRVVWTTRRARLIERGPQVSEVQFADSGASQAIPNEQLEFEPNTEDEERAANARRRCRYGYDD